LRPNHRVSNGKGYIYWSLVETAHTPDGPHQRIVCYLGELSGSVQARWLRTVEAFNEKGQNTATETFPFGVTPPEDDPQVARAAEQSNERANS
jgi:hypothetical protein